MGQVLDEYYYPKYIWLTLKLELEYKGSEPWDKTVSLHADFAPDFFAELKLINSLQAKFSVYPVGQEAWTVEVQLQGTQLLQCARTLEDMRHEVNVGFTVQVSRIAGIKNQQFSDENEDFFEIDIPQGQSFIDFAECVRQMIVLHEPINPVKDPNASFNWIDPEAADEESTTMDPRWEKLKDWKPKA